MTYEEFVAGAGLLVAAGGFVYAGLQLRGAQRAARGSFLLDIHEALRHHDAVHRRLDDPTDGPKWKPPEDPPAGEIGMHDLEAYMGVFERIQFLVEDGLLELETVDKLYSFRIINITRNPHIVEAKFGDKAVFWSGFLRLWRDLENCERWGENISYLDDKGYPVPGPAPRSPRSRDGDAAPPG